MKFEANFQRTKNGKWETRTFNSQQAAKQAAEVFGRICWNCNWQATNPGQENCPAWTRRNGKEVK